MCAAGSLQWIPKGGIWCLVLLSVLLEIVGCGPGTVAFCHVPDFDAAVVHYFLTQGAQVQGVVVTQHNVSGYGVSAIQDLPADAVVLQVPAHQILCLEQIRHGPMSLVLHILDSAFDLTADGMFWPLALTVMFERHQVHSKWRPYMDYLPSMSNMPVAWNESTIQAAALYPYARQMIHEIQDLADSVARFIFPQLHVHHPKTFSMFGVDVSNELSEQQIMEWRTSVATVWSRSFLLELGGSDQWGLVPLADLLNHCTGEQNNYVMAAPTPYLDAFELRTAHVLREGQELCINYGNHTSMQFFLFYGFVPSSRDFIGTPKDFIYLQFPVQDLVMLATGQAGFHDPREFANVKIRLVIPRADGVNELARQVCEISWFTHVTSIAAGHPNTTSFLPDIMAQSIVDDLEWAIMQAMDRESFARGTRDHQRIQCPTTGADGLPARVDEQLRLLRCVLLSDALHALGSIRATWQSVAQDSVPLNHCPGPDSTQRVIVATKFQGLERNQAVNLLLSRAAVATDLFAEVRQYVPRLLLVQCFGVAIGGLRKILVCRFSFLQAGPAVDIVDVALSLATQQTLSSDVARQTDGVQCVSKPTAERVL